MNDNALSLLLESITNLGNRMFAIESELITYMEHNPKGDNQWTETRIRALEEKVKALEERQDPKKYLNNVIDKQTATELEKIIDKHHNGT